MYYVPLNSSLRRSACGYQNNEIHDKHAKDTNDILKEFGKIESSSLLYGGDDTGKYLLFLGPLILQQNEQLTQSPIVFWVTEGHVFERSDDDLHTEWHDLL